MRNKYYQILPLAISLTLLTMSYGLSAGGLGKEAHSQETSIEEVPLPRSLAVSPEDDEAVCGLKEIVCPFEVKKTYTAWATKFSRADSCHNRKGDKCLTAIGQDTQEGITVACPRWLKLGSKVRILGHIYTCHDRYAQWVQNRQGDTFDIFTENYNEAKNFGRQKLEIIVL